MLSPRLLLRTFLNTDEVSFNLSPLGRLKEFKDIESQCGPQ